MTKKTDSAAPLATTPIVPPELAQLLQPNSTFPPAPYRQQLLEAVQFLTDYFEPDSELRLQAGEILLQLLLMMKQVAPMHMT